MYPGTFNPFHRGHLEAVLAAAQGERRVLVVLAADATNPHKPQPASSEHRARLAQLAIDGAGASEFVRVVVCEGDAAPPDLRSLLERQAADHGLAPMSTTLLCGDDVIERLSPANFFGQRVLVMKRFPCDLRVPRSCYL